MTDLSYNEAARAAIDIQGAIMKLAMVIGSVSEAEQLFYEQVELYAADPTRQTLWERIDALQRRIILEGWPLDAPEPDVILST